MHFKIAVTLTSFVLVAQTATAGPGDINADKFYHTAKELSDKGVTAMFDKRTKPTMAQLKAAAQTVKAENASGEARGEPIYCVSAAARKKGLNHEFVIEKLGAIPAQRRKNMTLTAAWREVLVREYPCR